MPRTKAPASVSPSQIRNSHPPISSSGFVGRSNNDRTVHGHDRSGGFIHLDNDAAHSRLGHHGYDYSRQHHAYPYRSPFGPGHYYGNYRSIYYPGCRYYSPYSGYTYSTAYLAYPYVSTPYVTGSYITAPYAVGTYYDTLGYGYAAPAYAATTAPVSPEVTQPPSTTTAPPAVDAYQPLTTTATDSPAEKGNAAFAAGRYDEARGLYARAVMTDERDGYAKSLYAWANFALGDYEVAAAALRRALLTTPELMDYPPDLRTLYPDRAVLDRQADALQRFIADHPEHREAQLVWGYLLYSIGQAEPAASVFTALASADQDDTLLSLLRDAAGRKLETRD